MVVDGVRTRANACKGISENATLRLAAPSADREERRRGDKIFNQPLTMSLPVEQLMSELLQQLLSAATPTPAAKRAADTLMQRQPIDGPASLAAVDVIGDVTTTHQPVGQFGAPGDEFNTIGMRFAQPASRPSASVGRAV